MFDPEKPVQTRDGRKARIICTDVLGKYPIAAVVEFTPGRECVTTFNTEGECGADPECDDDLVNIPSVLEKRWALLYNGATKIPLVRLFNTKNEALLWLGNRDPEYADIEVTACLEFTEGDGLRPNFDSCTFTNTDSGIKT